MKGPRFTTYDNLYNIIDIYKFIKEKYPYITLKLESINWRLGFEEIGIYIDVPEFYKVIAGIKSAGSYIVLIQDDIKYDTYELKLANDFWFRREIEKLEEAGNYEEIERIKNIKYMPFEEQEKLYKALKKAFEFKPKAIKPDLAIHDPKWERGFILDGLKNKEIHSYFYEHKLNKIFAHRDADVEESKREDVKTYKKMLSEYLSKPEVQKELKELEILQELQENYEMENYVRIKDLNGNIVDPRKLFKDNPFNTGIPLYVYTAKEAVEKIKELESKGEL